MVYDLIERHTLLSKRIRPSSKGKNCEEGVGTFISTESSLKQPQFLHADWRRGV
jgi:hypothetical protein